MQEKKFDKLRVHEKEKLDEAVKDHMESLEKKINKERGLVELTEDLSTIKIFLMEAIDKIRHGGNSRCRSIAITKLEEARMWIDEEIKTSLGRQKKFSFL